MTERTDGVQPPLAKRHVQLTIVAVASSTLIWIMLTSGVSSRHPGGARRDGEALREPGRLIEIDINNAQPRELALLPGVGPVLAKRIADNRRRLGPFQSVDDLARVHGIGPKTLAEIRDFCVVAADPKEAPSLAGQWPAPGKDK